MLASASTRVVYKGILVTSSKYLAELSTRFESGFPRLESVEFLRSPVELYFQANLPPTHAGRITEVLTNSHALRLLVGGSRGDMAAGVSLL